MANCTHCARVLNRARYNKGETMKSCPKCSDDNGKEHVFHSYPAAFGTTPARATARHDEGPQSWCEDCRFERTPPPGTLCNVVKP